LGVVSSSAGAGCWLQGVFWFFSSLSCLVLSCFVTGFLFAADRHWKGKGGTDIRMDGWMDGGEQVFWSNCFFSDYLYGFLDGVTSPWLED
jgi:hypothetical protein